MNENIRAIFIKTQWYNKFVDRYTDYKLNLHTIKSISGRDEVVINSHIRFIVG